jgi:hypothetical protein
MKSIKFFSILFLLSLICSVSFASLTVNGLFRNDMIFSANTDNDIVFSDILETRLILTRRASDWRFYGDMRIYIYHGAVVESMVSRTLDSAEDYLGMPLMVDLGEIFGEQFDYTLMNFNLMRAFVRYFSPVGDFTIGKTYVNFGSPGIFNPFEMDKGLDFSDLAYDKEGMLALMYEAPLGVLSGARLYISPKTVLSNTAAGFSLYGNLLGFDFGMVFNRKEYNRNSVGVYFKGDLEIGVEGAWAFHFDDYFTNSNGNFNEAKLGIDYSFFTGKLISALAFYYCEAGATDTDDYDYLSDLDKYFLAKYYLYGNITFVPDEFFSAQLDCFVNMIDFSAIIIPSVNYILADGFNVGLQFAYIWGDDDREFSRDRIGEYSLLLRFEARL